MLRRFAKRQTSESLLPAGISSVLLLFFLSIVVHAERLPLKSYTVADGLAHNVVNKIVRDSRGFLWFCTAGGLSRFDGYGFTNYGTAQGLPHANVTDLLETSTGAYWIATNAGLVSFNPRGAATNKVSYDGESNEGTPMFIVVGSAGPDPRAQAITVLYEDHAGSIWCGTLKGLVKLDRINDRLTLRAIDIGILSDYPEHSFVTDLLEDRNGSLWIASPSGLYRRWPNGEIEHYTTRDGLPSDYIEDLSEDHEGHFWAASPLGGFFRINTEGAEAGPVVAEAYAKRDGLPTDWVFQLFETTDHHFWIATNKGLVEFLRTGDGQGRKFHAYTTKNGLSYPEITALNEDLGGNLWLGTNSNGSMKVVHNGFITYDERDALFQVNATFADRAGDVCFEGNVLGDTRTSVFEGAKLDLLDTNPPTLYQRYGCFDGQRFSWFKPRGNYNFGWVMEGVVVNDRRGEWWLGSGVGLYHFPAADTFTKIKSLKPLALYGKAQGLAASQVFRIFEDSRTDIWISTISAEINGLARWERADGRIHDLKDSPGLPDLKVQFPRSFAEDQEGRIWVGFNQGLARYSEGKFRYFSAEDGLPQGAVMCIYLDHVGRLWLASARSGLIRIENPGAEHPNFVAYTTAQGLATNNIAVIIEDALGNIYCGGGNGLDRLDPATGRIKHFTTADGLAEGVFRSAFRDHHGELWFGMARGLSRFVPEPDPMPLSPTVLISSLRVGGLPRLVSALGETELALADLPANDNQLRLNFFGLSFAPGNVLRYQYKLEGADADWSSPGDEREVNYANLAPGHYRFLVRALDSHGTLSFKPASVTFTILKPIWGRWWFLTLIALILGFATYSLYRYRVSRILAFANMRTRIATDLHDDIGANLTKIAILSEVERQKRGGHEDLNGPLSSIARISRDSVASMSDIVWAINPERDNLLDLVRRMRRHAEEVFTTRNIALEFRAPNPSDDLKLSVDVRRDLFLIFKEAVNNVVRYSQCSRVEIDFRAEEGKLLLQVSDNGVGFDQSADSEGQGLSSMNRRARAGGGSLEIESRPDGGTTIRCRVPLGRSRHAL